MAQLRRNSSRNIPTVILIVCCGLLLIGLGAGDHIISKASSSDTLTTLENNRVPAGDWREEAIRLKGIPDIPKVVSETPASYVPGDTVEFYVTNIDTGESRKLSARLVYETPNVYFFVEDGVQVDDNDVKSLVDEFQNST